MIKQMIQLKSLGFILLISSLLMACAKKSSDEDNAKPTIQTEKQSVQAPETNDKDNVVKSSEFQHEAEEFADIRVLRYQVPGFDSLPVQQKELIYYLYQAALAGRDIMWDQNYRHNLRIRRTLEEIIKHYQGNKADETYQKFLTYTKQVWVANGIHHHYSNNKILPEFSFDDFKLLAKKSPNATFPRKDNQTTEQLLLELKPLMFDPDLDGKKVNKDKNADKVMASAVNFYRGVTQAEVEQYYQKKLAAAGAKPVSYGLNSRLVKENGEIKEKVWKAGGLYSSAIEEIVVWLDKASEVAENEKQRKALQLLSQYYQSGDLKDFDEYNIAWVNDTDSMVDVINGFIEVYNDPIAYRGSFESVVSIRDIEATKRIKVFADNAQWFEDNSPLIESHKKPNVKGITGKAILVVVESGDASPTTPIGINLPNSNWIRAEHGSKSVSLSNIVSAYNASPGKSLEEFAYTEEEIKLAKQYSDISGHLLTDLHEVVGHASGRINEGVGTPKETLKQYGSTLEEARADLFGLYYLMDEKLIELGLMPSLDVGKVAYNSYIRNGLIQQLYRLKLGEQLEEDHMRNRQLVAAWVEERGKKDNVIERKIKDGKTYTVINDYTKLRTLFGELLREIQRIKSEGDFQAAEQLVETYGVKVDQTLHQEVLNRYATLDAKPYTAFINPVLVPLKDGDKIYDVKIEYPDNFEQQMLDYAKQYSLLPTDNG